MELEKFIETKAGTLKLDWDQIESELGFKVHENAKNFYSRCAEDTIEGYINFTEDAFIRSYENKKYDKWFSCDECEDEIEEDEFEEDEL